MPKGNNRSYVLDMSESLNWNSAEIYSKYKIAKLLISADKYETIAEFGTEELEDEFMIDEGMVNQARIKAIKRLAQALEMLISNSIFAMKKRDYKNTLKEYQAKVKFVRANLHLVERKVLNQRDKSTEIKIDEEKFRKFLEVLKLIKEEVNEPLNQSDLIFGSIEEFDPDKYKQQVLDQMGAYG